MDAKPVIEWRDILFLSLGALVLLLLQLRLA